MVVTERITGEPRDRPTRTPRYRWAFISIALIAFAIVGLCLGLPLYQRAVAVRTVEDGGGYVETRGAAPWSKLVEHDVAKYLDDIVAVDTQSVHGWDAYQFDFECLGSFPRLERLNLITADLSDEALRPVGALLNLKDLNLSYTEIGNVGLEQLKGLTQLESLNLMRTRVTDAGLRHLHAMTHLKVLDLSETGVTDSGVNDLKNLTALEMVFAHRTHVTDAAVEKIKRSLPHVEVYNSLPR